MQPGGMRPQRRQGQRQRHVTRNGTATPCCLLVCRRTAAARQAAGTAAAREPFQCDAARALLLGRLSSGTRLRRQRSPQDAQPLRHARCDQPVVLGPHEHDAHAVRHRSQAPGVRRPRQPHWKQHKVRCSHHHHCGEGRTRKEERAESLETGPHILLPCPSTRLHVMPPRCPLPPRPPTYVSPKVDFSARLHLFPVQNLAAGPAGTSTEPASGSGCHQWAPLTQRSWPQSASTAC